MLFSKKEDHISSWLNYSTVIAANCVGLLQIISGTYQIIAVYRIKRHVDSSGIKSAFINIKALVLHSIMFVLYLLNVLILYTAFNFYAFEPRSSKKTYMYF